jgi:translation initiation factor IF-2
VILRITSAKADVMTAEETAAAEAAAAEAKAKTDAEAAAEAKRQGELAEIEKIKAAQLKELEKAREIRETAEKEAKEAKRKLAADTKTVEERVATIEAENKSLKLEKLIDAEIAKQAKAIQIKDGKETGYSVDLEAVADLRDIANITEDNLEKAISKMVKTATRQATKKSGDDNTQGRSDKQKTETKIDLKNPPSLEDAFSE